ncbi:hypothetical protein AVEN_105085-1 [Araneus ventricosus]|uniref:Uncharacterized protein n=1 Tax=Araneus ventricosus TaxID=182803 RepID=A0A4Y2GPN0_ARAVE|nr:hypothetical protein AVEN_105085-1 [Araneus ventricosus]
MNAVSQSKIGHFECCDDDLITSDAPSDDDIVFLIKEKNDLIHDSSSDMEDLGDVSSAPSFSGAKTAVNMWRNFFAPETVDKIIMNSFLIIDKKIDEMCLKSRFSQQKKSLIIFIL